ncbi:MAG: PIN domain-containing protein [Gammaproteobacteria bacterium]
MRILFDTNVILDILLDRQPYSEDAAALLSYAERGDISGYAAATTITTLYYLCARAGGSVKAKRQVASILALIEIAPVNRSVIESALASRMRDFEDAVLAAAGALVRVEAIATRNKQDFRLGRVATSTPRELLELLQLRG